MFVDIFNTDKKYKVIYADPPWNERGGGKIKVVFVRETFFGKEK